MLLEEHRDKMAFSVSHTTRKPRAGEKDGVHYHFTPKDKMEQMIKVRPRLKLETRNSKLTAI